MADKSALPIGEATWAKLRGVSTATLTSQLLSRGLRNTYLAGVLPLAYGGTHMVGEAFTLRYIPAREDIDVMQVFQDYDHPQRKAVETVGPGQVLVMDCRGQTRAASLGAILAERLWQRGVAGVVSDGAYRDSHVIAKSPLPAYAAGVSATTNLAQHHAVDIQVPIGCAEVPVYPGDVVVGDQEGVVIVPRHLAGEIADAAFDQERLEAFLQKRIAAGAALRGVYPASAELLSEYHATVKSSPERSGFPTADPGVVDECV